MPAASLFGPDKTLKPIADLIAARVTPLCPGEAPAHGHGDSGAPPLHPPGRGQLLPDEAVELDPLVVASDATRKAIAEVLAAAKL